MPEWQLFSTPMDTVNVTFEDPPKPPVRVGVLIPVDMFLFLDRYASERGLSYGAVVRIALARLEKG